MHLFGLNRTVLILSKVTISQVAVELVFSTPLFISFLKTITPPHHLISTPHVVMFQGSDIRVGNGDFRCI